MVQQLNQNDCANFIYLKKIVYLFKHYILLFMIVILLIQQMYLRWKMFSYFNVSDQIFFIFLAGGGDPP